MLDSYPFQAPQPNPPAPPTPVPNVDLPPDAPPPKPSISDQLSGFSDYLSEFPERLSGLKSFALIGLLLAGSSAGIVLLKQDSDVRKQASEGNKVLSVCAVRDATKMSLKEIPNSKGCLLNGTTYYACEAEFTFTNKQCIPNK